MNPEEWKPKLPFLDKESAAHYVRVLARTEAVGENNAAEVAVEEARNDDGAAAAAAVVVAGDACDDADQREAAAGQHGDVNVVNVEAGDAPKGPAVVGQEEPEQEPEQEMGRDCCGADETVTVVEHLWAAVEYIVADMLDIPDGSTLGSGDDASGHGGKGPDEKDLSEEAEMAGMTGTLGRC